MDKVDFVELLGSLPSKPEFLRRPERMTDCCSKKMNLMSKKSRDDESSVVLGVKVRSFHQYDLSVTIS